MNFRLIDNNIFKFRLDTKQSWLTLHYVDGPAEAVACRFEVQVSDQVTFKFDHCIKCC